MKTRAKTPTRLSTTLHVDDRAGATTQAAAAAVERCPTVARLLQSIDPAVLETAYHSADGLLGKAAFVAGFETCLQLLADAIETGGAR
jgi:hypothetical protein